VRKGFGPPRRLEVLDHGDPLRRLAALDYDDNGLPGDRVEALLAQWSRPTVGFSASWLKKVTGGGRDIQSSVVVTVLGAQTSHIHFIPFPIDLLWDVGDSRRYTPEGVDGRPTSHQVVADLAVLVDLGVESIWGVDVHNVVNPDHLHTVFHRNRDHFRDDGSDPPFPPVPVEPLDIDLALEETAPWGVMSFATPAGPVLYHSELQSGRLHSFYTALRTSVNVTAEDLDGG